MGFNWKILGVSATDGLITEAKQVLGELPSKTGAFLVMNNIARQVHEQTPAES